MIKALSLAAALALLPLSAALAQEAPAADPAAAEAALDAAAEAFEARMEEFGERAERIEADDSLTQEQQEAAIRTLWAQYEPLVVEFTAFAAQQAGVIAAEALAGIDMEALVADALAGVDMDSVMSMARNGAWASNDPEHMATYGLMADYALGEVVDSVGEIEIDLSGDDLAEADLAAAQADIDAQNAEAARAD